MACQLVKADAQIPLVIRSVVRGQNLISHGLPAGLVPRDGQPGYTGHRGCLAAVRDPLTAADVIGAAAVQCNSFHRLLLLFTPIDS